MGADYRMDAQQGKSCREAVYSNEYYDLIFDYISGYPRLESGLNLIWKKYQIFSPAADLFLKEVQARFQTDPI